MCSFLVGSSTNNHPHLTLLLTMRCHPKITLNNISRWLCRSYLRDSCPVCRSYPFRFTGKSKLEAPHVHLPRGRESEADFHVAFVIRCCVYHTSSHTFCVNIIIGPVDITCDFLHAIVSWRHLYWKFNTWDGTRCQRARNYRSQTDVRNKLGLLR